MFTFTDAYGRQHQTELNINYIIASRLHGTSWSDIRADITLNQLRALRNSAEYHSAIGWYLRKNALGIPPKYQRTFGVQREALDAITKAYM